MLISSRVRNLPRLVVVALALTLAPSAGRAQDAAPEPITKAPSYSSSIEGVEIVSVNLAEDATGGLVQVTLRNAGNDAVIGVQFEILGSAPTMPDAYGELSGTEGSPERYLIEPQQEYFVEIPISTFDPGSRLRLSAVLYASGRGEGDAEQVKEMKREAESLKQAPPNTP